LPTAIGSIFDIIIDRTIPVTPGMVEVQVMSHFVGQGPAVGIDFVKVKGLTPGFEIHGTHHP
jgi:hypothetical protein